MKNPFIGLFTVFVALVAIGGYLAVREAVKQAKHDATARAQRVERGLCERQNLVRADRRLTVIQRPAIDTERQRVMLLFPILDCEKTVAAGSAVLLATPEVNVYMDTVKRDLIPEVHDGRVAGSFAP